jgi:glucosamine--fructose-6-phosphate aminotransferase (isomerizing)
MCGIFGVVGQQDAAPILLNGLRQLEYRGYDSAGIATHSSGLLHERRAQGKVERLAKQIAEQPIHGGIGIAHTRWATHGKPSERNAHPIATPEVAVVHNGIIENHREIRTECESRGDSFTTDTDTEAVAMLVTRHIRNGLSPIDAVNLALKRIEGTFALAMLFSGPHEFIICARRGSPLAVGHGDGAMYAGSDALALAPATQRITYLEDGDRAIVSRDRIEIFDANMERVDRPIIRSGAHATTTGKAGHPHFMRKEIFEQPYAIERTLTELLTYDKEGIILPKLPFLTSDIERVSIVACGTSYHAGLVARYWLETYAGVNVDIDVASEFRYRNPRIPAGTLVLGISQSGETADTLAAMRYAKSQGAPTLAIVNQMGSGMAREADAILHTKAGPEIGVASTKAFTTQLTVLAALTIGMGIANGSIEHTDSLRLIEALRILPLLAVTVLKQDDHIKQIAETLSEANDVLFLGRGTAFPIALEGALKLKETSYIHAEGYPAGELKHGPIALIDNTVPVVVIAPPDDLFAKTASNMAEVMARGGQVILISTSTAIDEQSTDLAEAIKMPDCDPFVAPILYSIPVQLLAYHAALHRGTDVDQPRNLAKSVTVE